MSHIDIMKQALDALEYYDEGITGPTTASAVINLLRAAIEQPESEPVGHFIHCGEPSGWCEVSDEHKTDSDVVPLYAASKVTDYVPLTDTYIIKIAQDNVAAEPGRDGYILPISFARAIEKAVRGES